MWDLNYILHCRPLVGSENHEYRYMAVRGSIFCSLQGFSAPSYDDKLMEVVGITGITQVTTAKVLGIQNQRIAQCRYAKLTIHGQDTVPMQVDGEAWLQEPGIIVVSHKNKARIIFKDKVGWKHILLPQMMISGP